MSVWNQAACILLVLALAACLRMLRGGASGSSSLWRQPKPGALDRLDSIRLTPQHAVHLVSCGGRVLTLATHPGGCTLLAEQETAHAFPEAAPARLHAKTMGEGHA